MTASPDDPAFLAALWTFLANEGREEALSPESPDARDFACYLAGMWIGMTVEFHVLARKMTRDQAEQATTDLIAGQRALYEVLAASSPQPPAASGG